MLPNSHVTWAHWGHWKSVVDIRACSKKIKCKILNQGILKSNKAVAIPGTESSLDYFTEETIKGLNFAKKINATFVGLSFIRNEKDVQEVKKFYKNINEMFENIENFAMVSIIEEKTNTSSNSN